MCMASMRESRGSDRFKSTHKYNHMYCCAEGLALQCLSLCTLMKSYRAAKIEKVPVRYRPNAASGGWSYGRDLVSLP